MLHTLLQLRSRLVIRLFCISILLNGAAANFHEGDFVPTSRRAQFHHVRKSHENRAVLHAMLVGMHLSDCGA